MIPGTPQSFAVQTANGQILVSWALSAGATSYIVQRSLDNVTFATISTVSGDPLATSYLDTAVILGTQYFYIVAAASTDGTSPYTISQAAIPAPTGEMSLADIRNQAKQRADRVDSQFVTDPEWRNYINKARFELYDLLVTVFEDYYSAIPAAFTADGQSFQYALPDGFTTYLNGLNMTAGYAAPNHLKTLGIDLGLDTSNNGWVTVDKYNFIDRNRFVYPNSNSTIYGVFNCQYRIMGNNIQFIPTPSSGQIFRIWYIPRLNELLQDTDVSNTGFSGWDEYVVVRAAKYALDKEESDTSVLTQEIAFLKSRIEASAANRDAGMPDTISNTRAPWGNGGAGYGPNQRGGW